MRDLVSTEQRRPRTGRAALPGAASNPPAAPLSLAVAHYNAGAFRTTSAFGVTEASLPARPRLDDEEILDAVAAPAASFRERQLQAYLFDTLVLRSITKGDDADLRANRNSVAQLLGHATFFEASCSIRAIDAFGIERLALRLLDETDESFHREMRSAFRGPVDEGQLSAVYEDVLTAGADAYPFQSMFDYLNEQIGLMGLDERIRVIRGSRSGVSTNVTTLAPRRSTIFAAEASGLESFRALCHALGHAIYAVSDIVVDEDLLGVNVAATEVCAFAAQEIALTDVDERARVLLDLMPTYYARLYALRLLDEAHFYREGLAAVSGPATYEARLGLRSDRVFRPGKRLSAVDFVIGFAAYLRLDPTSSWQDVPATITSNARLIGEHSCLAPGVGFA